MNTAVASSTSCADEQLPRPPQFGHLVQRVPQSQRGVRGHARRRLAGERIDVAGRIAMTRRPATSSDITGRSRGSAPDPSRPRPPSDRGSPAAHGTRSAGDRPRNDRSDLDNRTVGVGQHRRRAGLDGRPAAAATAASSGGGFVVAGGAVCAATDTASVSRSARQQHSSGARRILMGGADRNCRAAAVRASGCCAPTRPKTAHPRRVVAAVTACRERPRKLTVDPGGFSRRRRPVRGRLLALWSAADDLLSPDPRRARAGHLHRAVLRRAGGGPEVGGRRLRQAAPDDGAALHHRLDHCQPRVAPAAPSCARWACERRR